MVPNDKPDIVHNDFYILPHLQIYVLRSITYTDICVSCKRITNTFAFFWYISWYRWVVYFAFLLVLSHYEESVQNSRNIDIDFITSIIPLVDQGLCIIGASPIVVHRIRTVQEILFRFCFGRRFYIYIRIL
jgi:hypothetical protein